MEVGLDCPVLATDDVVSRLCFPRGARNGLTEQVCQRPHLRGPYELLLRFGQIAGEFRDPRRAKKQPTIRHLDMLEDRGLGELRLVGLRRVTVLRRQRANIDGCDSTLCGLWWGFGERGKPDYGDDETE